MNHPNRQPTLPQPRTPTRRAPLVVRSFRMTPELMFFLFGVLK